MNFSLGTIQKSLLSAATILFFSLYSYWAGIQPQDAASAANPDTSAVGTAQSPSGNTGALSQSDYQAYIDKINAEAAAQPRPSIQRRGEDDGEYEGEDEGEGRRIAVQTTVQQAPAQQASTPAPTQTPVSTPAPAPVAIALPKGQYTDGTYTGSNVNVYYGYVQVQAIVKGGKLTDVKFLSYPSDRNTSVDISAQAMPLLIQEAIQAQSAQVNGVSGASATSQGFVQSLDAALSKARV